MKSPIDLLRVLLTDCGQRCHVSTDRDFKRIAGRLKHEGFSFLGITLASFGKDFQKDLDRGFVSPDSYAGFSRRAGLPELFRGFLENVFQPGDGLLRPDPCVDCIRSVRQITLMWAKMKSATTPQREAAAFNQYIEREKNVRTVALRILEDAMFSESDVSDSLSSVRKWRTSKEVWSSSALRRFQNMSQRLFGPALSAIDLSVYRGEVVPRHGPGSVADSLSGNQKWAGDIWDEQLEHVFPISEYFYSSYARYLESEVSHTPSRTPLPVKVIAVPKTHDKPRIIAMEPAGKMYLQQGIMALFEKVYDSPTIHGSENNSYHFINYRSQLPNQQMATRGSRDGSLATLDLSEASDSVSYLLVHAMLRNFPHLYEAVDATRSRNADVPGHGIIPISKFASMGSALCFPIEAMVFCTVVFLGIEEHLRRPITSKDIKSLRGDVRIYGDDIIIPVEYTSSVVSSLELYGFSVNKHKSFWGFNFRESCGQDAFRGEDVNVIRFRKEIPTQRRQAEEIISFVSLRNQLYKAGYWYTVRELDKSIEKLIPFPATKEGSPGLGKISFTGYESQRWDDSLQRPLVKAAVPVYKKRNSPLDGDRGLVKWFFYKRLPGSDNPLSKDHLLYAGRPVAVDIKHRWVHPDYGMDGP
ncbi:RNA-directed RNA polymerase [ssRNA phage Gerhypos.1_17]|uniref:RNA-directed RNA polymerase n=2 Tax=Leviviricetes TaxID=2842243 RepID=A0A8S5L295_9VIRU|nr:RNA-directed RNA polymerase [ssRNA phage Gerhypos.1_17]QDH89915.1 MAG: RNA-dependent RNA polymerase [Leviviridae sp.]DAD51958.1 TPA_asm: RNA-directed RNA polymerase [ssRNA phage Gerhypos.1_17]